MPIRFKSYLLSLFLVVFSVISLYAQKNIIGVNLDNNAIVAPGYNVKGFTLSVDDVNHTRTFFTYGRAIANNLYITTGLGFEIMSVNLVKEPEILLHVFESRRFLLPVGLRYAADVNKTIAITGQAGAQVGLFVSGVYKYMNKDAYTYTQQKKGIYENLTIDLNFALGVDVKLNSKNVINVSPNVIVYTADMLKGASELKPVSVGLRIGYAYRL